VGGLSARPEAPATLHALRGPVLTWRGDPFVDGVEASRIHEPDALVVIADGHIAAFGPAETLLPTLPAGTPVAEHRRNAHRYLRDATQELPGICVLEDLLPWLVELRLEGDSYAEAYFSLSVLLEDSLAGFSGFIWTDSTREYFHCMAASMRAWVAACRQMAAV